MKVPVKVKTGCKQRKLMLLSQKDIQEAVCDGILQANTKINPPVEEGKRVGFWKRIWWIARGKGSGDSRYTTAIFTSLLGSFFNTLAFLGLAMFIAMICSAVEIIGTWTRDCNLTWANIFELLSMVGIILLVFVFALMFRGAANDMKQEKDRNYIIALFSGVVSFAALIVALVALLKG